MEQSDILTGDDLVRFHRGEEVLFSELIREYSPRLLAIARVYAADALEARDLLQETWRQIYKKRMSYSASGSLISWCYAICRNVCLGALRRNGRGKFEIYEDRPGCYGENAAFSPYALAERAALRRAVAKALRRLPSRERAVLVSRLIEQRSTRETAEALNCAEGTVKATLHHAVRKMQIAMKAWET